MALDFLFKLVEVAFYYNVVLSLCGIDPPTSVFPWLARWQIGLPTCPHRLATNDSQRRGMRNFANFWEVLETSRETQNLFKFERKS